VAGGAEEPRALPGSGDRAVAAATAAALERRRSELVGSPAPVTVVICTQGRPAHLRRVLEALLALDYDPFEIVIVDNDPSSRHVADTVHDVAPSAMTATASPDGPRPGDAPIMRYVTEPRRGLSHARNAGLRAARGSIIAFTDDDAIVEPGWLTALAAGFGRDPDVGCVTGFTLPASLDTTAECQFEQFGGHSKARGLVDTLIDPADMPDGQHPLYPFPAFGAGVNMAFRREVLEEVGGFDPALGAGTLTKGCEDTAAFADVLLSGRKLAYEPMAVVHHFHRRTTNELVTQINGYGIALTAYFTWCLARRPRQALGLLGSVGKAVRYLLGRNPDHLSRQADEYPAQLTRAHRLGMVYGPFAYLRSALRERAR
jgi:GT2 family glycosyltransferase